MDQQLRDNLERYISGGMSDDESREFLRSIHQNTEAMAYLGQVLTQQAMLFELQRAGLLSATSGTPASDGVPVPLPGTGANGGARRPLSLFHKIVWSVGLAACALIAANAFLAQQKPPAAPRNEEPGKAPQGLGRVVFVNTANNDNRAVLVRGKDSEALREGQEVHSGDVIRTEAAQDNAARAFAGVQLWNGAMLDIGPLSTIALLESERGKNVRLYRGRVYTDVNAANSTDNLKIETDFADVELATGRFDISVDSKATRLRVESGQGFIFNERGRTIVRQLEESMAQIGVAPNGPIAILATALWRGRNGTLSMPAPETTINRNVGVVTHIKVLSDKVDDVSSFEAWRAATILPEMTDRERAIAAWETAIKYQQTDSPPVEYLGWDTDQVMDPIKSFNVYGYAAGPGAIASMLGLSRTAGMTARGWAGPNVAEVYWSDTWHVFDTVLISYFPKLDGELASVDELVADVNTWYGQHPEYRGNDQKLREFMVNEGWKKGPVILAQCPFLDKNGWNLDASHGWYSFMKAYTGTHPDGKPIRPFESGYSTGYQLNIQLREGERLTRNWSNEGLHVGSAWGEPESLKVKGPKFYTRKFGDLSPARIGNGKHEYTVPLASPTLKLSALEYTNLACRTGDGRAPALHLKDGAQPAALVLRMPSSYVYLDGKMDVTMAVGQNGRIITSISDNNGLDWKVIDTATASGRKQIELKQHIFRRYDYRLKFELEGADSGLDALSIVNTIQHSQRALPILGKGTNTISFSAQAPECENTISIEGSTNKEFAAKQLVIGDFHPQIEKLEKSRLFVSGDRGQITLPISTPGDMTRLRIGCYYRARDQRDGWEVSASFDGGKTFKIIDRLWGPTAGFSTSLKYTEIPAGSRQALVRLYGVQRTTTAIFDLRIDADYKEPAGGFRPVKITYNWEENGVAKSDVHVAMSPDEKYAIDCADKPVMKSIVLELAE